jgi:uncharacterized membrane protein YbaN (DUF454 family)
MIFIYIALFGTIVSFILLARHIYNRDVNALNDILYEKTRTVEILQDYSTELEKTRDSLKRRITDLQQQLDLAISKLQPASTKNEKSATTSSRRPRKSKSTSNNSNK